jgi:DNA-binding PadR family transcriptional regulator
MKKTEDLEFHVLSCLAAANNGKHGYAVRRWLLEHLAMTVPLQSIYRLIIRLHEKGLVECQEGTFSDSYAGMPRKTYNVTTDGWDYIAKRASEVRSQITRLTLSLKEYEKVVSYVEQQETHVG